MGLRINQKDRKESSDLSQEDQGGILGQQERSRVCGDLRLRANLRKDMIGREQMAKRHGDRPVESHLIRFLQQNLGVGYSIKALMKELDEMGWRHCGKAIADNCLLLVEQGSVIKKGICFGIPINGDIEVTELPHQSIPSPYHTSKLQHDKCDRCGRNFESNDEIHLRRFSNMAEMFYLCENCYEQKAVSIA